MYLKEGVGKCRTECWKDAETAPAIFTKKDKVQVRKAQGERVPCGKTWPPGKCLMKPGQEPLTISQSQQCSTGARSLRRSLEGKADLPPPESTLGSYVPQSRALSYDELRYSRYLHSILTQQKPPPGKKLPSVY